MTAPESVRAVHPGFLGVKVRLMPPALVLAALAVAPSMLDGNNLRITTTALIFAIFALSMDLLLGYGGMVSLGHALFFGIGAYSVGLLGYHLHLGPAVTLPVAVLAAAVIAAAVGKVIQRARGAAFMMITLATAQVFWGVAMQWKSLTKGDDGLFGIGPPMIGSFDLSGRLTYYYVVLVILVVVFVLMRQLVRSPFGYALQGSRENEQRISVLGASVAATRFRAFIIAAVIASVAGVLFAYQQRYVSPSLLSVTMSGNVLLMVVLGGAGRVWGAFVGGVLVSLIEQVVGAHTERYVLLLGCLYVVVALFLPKGLAGLVPAVRRRLGRPRRGSADAALPPNVEITAEHGAAAPHRSDTAHAMKEEPR